MQRSSQLAARAAAAFVLVCALIITSGCAPSIPSEPPGITGSITSLERSADGEGAAVIRMLVEGESQPAGAVSDKAYVTVDGQTVVFGPDDEPATMEELGQGLRVEVWFDGAVAESYPVQGSAKVVRLVP